MAWKIFVRISVLALTAAGVESMASSQLHAQTSGGTTAVVTEIGGTSSDEHSRQRSINSPGSQQQDRRPSALYISGSVILEDGSPPPLGVVIERACGGQATREAYAGPDGKFSFQIGASGSFTLEASDSTQARNRGPVSMLPLPSSFPTNSAPMRITGCDLRARLGGYRSTVTILDMNQTTGTLDVGTLVLYPAARVPGTTVSITNLAAPKEAKRSMERAEKALQKKRLAEAEKHLDAALAAYPAYAEAWYRLGQLCRIGKRTDSARLAFTNAIEADANFVGPYVELARLAALDQKWQEAADLADTALRLNPLDFPYGYFVDALSNYHLNRMDRAEKSLRLLLRLDSRHRYPEAHVLLADIFRRRRDAAGEASQLLDYLKYAPKASDAPRVRARLQRLTGVPS